MSRKSGQDANQTETSLVVFMESYMKSLPSGFPHPSAEMLRTFQDLHPGLFRGKDGWSIEKHRKRIMDWLSSQGIGS